MKEALDTVPLIGLTVTAREELAGPATLFHLQQSQGAALPSWQPGQYLTLQLLIEGRTVMRSYSIATVDQNLQILVKKVDNGIASRYLIEHALVGTQLWAYPPKGSFTLRSAWNGKSVVLLAAGSGIAPILSLASHAKKFLPDSPVHLHHAARSIPELYFKVILERLREEQRLHYTTYISSKGERITPGVLQQRILPTLKHPVEEGTFMLCGPYVWMRSLRITLTFLGVSPEHILLEQFAAPYVPTRAIEQNFQGPCAAKLSSTTSSFTFPIHLGQTILEGAEGAGLHLPYSCRGGVCGSCAIRMTEGRVEMRQNEILSPKDIANGLCLSCTALPLTSEIAIQLA